LPSRTLSRGALERELAEQEKDLSAFLEAQTVLERRCVEARESEYCPILEWQGLDASLFVLGTCVQKLEGITEEYRRILRALQNGEILDADKPSLKLVEKTND